MVLTALRGALAFLSRFPVAYDEESWNAFRTTPAAFPLAGYVVGAAAAVPFLTPLPRETTALLYPVVLGLVAGINHVDGVADLGDAMVVHGDPDDRREVMKDTDTGVGALLAVALTVAGLALAGLALADFPVGVAVALVVAAEVGAKFGMATLACLGTAAHEGFGSAFTGVSPAGLVAPALVALPVAALTFPTPRPRRPSLRGSRRRSDCSGGRTPDSAGSTATSSARRTNSLASWHFTWG